MSDEAKPDTTPAADGGSSTDGGTPPPAKKKFEFDSEAQTFINSKIDEAYQRAFSKAETQFGGQLAEAQTKLETLTKELSAMKGGEKGEKKGDEGGDSKPGQPTKAEVEEEVKRLRAQINELQDGLKTIKSERDTLKTDLTNVEGKRREATQRDRFLEAMPANIQFFNVGEAYTLALQEGQLQLNDKGELVVMNPSTGLPRLGRDMEPMSPGDYIAEFAEKRPWMVKSEVTGGTGGTESRHTAVKTGTKRYEDMTPAELEAEIQRVKNQVRG